MKMRYQVLLLLAFGVLFAIFAFNRPTKSDEWAAWVQAWGSIAAICAAIWIAYDQHEKAQEQRKSMEADELRTFLAGVREELYVNWTVYMGQVGGRVLQSPAGQAIELVWPVPDNPFKFYGATVGMIGRLPDSDLRKSIIVTYVVAGGLLHTWRMHNELHDQRDRERRMVLESGGLRESERWRELNAQLQEYSGQLYDHQDQANSSIETTIEKIDAYLKSDESCGKSGPEVSSA